MMIGLGFGPLVNVALERNRVCLHCICFLLQIRWIVYMHYLQIQVQDINVC